MRISEFLLVVILFSPLLAKADPATRTVPLLVREQIEDGKVKGLSCFKKRLLSYFEQEMNIHFAIQSLPFRRAEQLTAQGGGLLWGMPAIPPENDRAGMYLFSDPVYSTYAWMVVRKDFKPRIKQVSDLQGLKLSTFYGVTYSSEFERQRGKLFEVEEEPDSETARLQKLLLGRVDISLMHSRYPSADTVKSTSIKSLPELQALEILPHPIEEMQIRFALGRKAMQMGKSWSHNLLAELNLAIERGHKTGAIQKIVSNTHPCH
ncbi:MAG: transporter substrate-binding domain-containing protein [Formivibrio sp.]|nr:transporter substrate-binding domain-containing protein [Formivibrio sp.]